MKKLPITKEAFEKSRYFKDKYGELEYVSESDKVFKTNKGRILMFKEGTESNPRFKCMESEKSDPLHICPYCGNDKVYDDPQSQDDKKIYLSDISDGGKFRVERHCSECDHYWDVVMKTIVDHIDGD